MRHLICSLRRWQKANPERAFTLIELLTVMAVIAILAGLILGISGYVNKKAALANTTAQLQALNSAIASYKADNGTYPHQALAVGGTIPAGSKIYSDSLDPRTNGNSGYISTNTAYINPSLELYEALTGDLYLTGTYGVATRNYLSGGRQDILGRSNMALPVSGSNPVEYLTDAFSNVIGYSTMNSYQVSQWQQGQGSQATAGYNPTYDLWSTGGSTSSSNLGTNQAGDPMLQWIKNWSF